MARTAFAVDDALRERVRYLAGVGVRQEDRSASSTFMPIAPRPQPCAPTSCGGIEETSASFEARSAPRSYPTPGCPTPWRMSSASCGSRMSVPI
jgi:hypothetical protein